MGVGRALVPEVARRQAMSCAEGAGKAGLRGEAGGQRHIHQGHVSVGDQTARLGQPELQVVILWRGVQAQAELLLQCARAGAQLICD